MRSIASKSYILFGLCLCLFTGSQAQTVTRELKLASGADLSVINHSGRVSVRAVEPTDPAIASGTLTATSEKGVADSEVTYSAGQITVKPVGAKKRIDIVITVPERCSLTVQATDGQIEASGNFAVINAATETGTIMTDVPTDHIDYILRWTDSRPRAVADFDLDKVREKSGGRFEIRGSYSGEVKGKKKKGESDEADGPRSKSEDPKPKTVSLNLTTARGIILLNVPPNEVGSDLRERPLTEAAKAIVRSGDSLLMAAIRRAAPKYFGDYLRSLPPLKMEPSFAAKASQSDGGVGNVKTATVRVTDLKNRAIAGLTADDFVVTESGKESEIMSVSRSTAPFNLVLLLDVSGSVENYVTFIRKAARAFVETVDARDRVSIVIFNDDVKILSKFSTDKGKLSESLDTFDAGGGTAYFDAIAYTISDTLRPLKGERTAVVILTDGEDNRSFLAFDSLTGSIEESGALIYPLYVPSGLIAQAALGNADIDPMRKKYMSLSERSQNEGEKLARVSGGVYYPISRIDQIQQAYEDIVVQLRTAYNVTYRSSSEAGLSPKLKIRSKREGTFAAISSVTSNTPD